MNIDNDKSNKYINDDINIINQNLKNDLIESFKLFDKMKCNYDKEKNQMKNKIINLENIINNNKIFKSKDDTTL